MINAEVPGLIDTRVLVNNPATNDDIKSNVNLLFNSAALLGNDVTSMSTDDFVTEQVTRDSHDMIL